MLPICFSYKLTWLAHLFFSPLLPLVIETFHLTTSSMVICSFLLRDHPLICVAPHLLEVSLPFFVKQSYVGETTVSTFHLAASHVEIDISKLSSTGPWFDHKRQSNLCASISVRASECVAGLQQRIDPVTMLCNTLDSVSLCVDVLRGNHTTAEKAVITETRLHQN